VEGRASFHQLFLMNESWMRRIWDRKGFLGRLLWLLFLPLSFFYSLAVRIIGFLYFLGGIKRQSLPRPVISVGNLTVGGTGKTPTTLWLAEELGRRGYKVAILSRGYKGKGTGIRVLGSNSALSTEEKEGPGDAGDEPVMMARIYGQRVGVGLKRYEAGERLLQDGEVDVFLLDDGFQHRQLNREIDLLLLGADCTGWLLPAGPFREPRGALRRAQLYLITGGREKWESFLRRYPKERIYFGSLEAKGLFTLDGTRWEERPLSMLDRRKIVTVSAISNPVSFYRIISDWEGEIIASLEFPDHHNYSIQDWKRINREARQAELIVTTEKDIVKLTQFPFPREKLLALRVGMVVENGSSLIQAVEEVLKIKGPSAKGSQ
jgi:tetraacyldisaccharide 4'-kinase